ncbi:MAG: hypothetical protein P4L33_06695 [Capsulimonadaceae bacterium]|nr:hypothetical protein [Capsulimonadaceae bacterium]
MSIIVQNPLKSANTDSELSQQQSPDGFHAIVKKQEAPSCAAYNVRALAVWGSQKPGGAETRAGISPAAAPKRTG